MSAQMLEVSLLGVGTVLRLERDAWQAANDNAPPPHLPLRLTSNLGSCAFLENGCFEGPWLL